MFMLRNKNSFITHFYPKKASTYLGEEFAINNARPFVTFSQTMQSSTSFHGVVKHVDIPSRLTDHLIWF